MHGVERWVPVRSGIYAVSDHGRVKRAQQGKRGVLTCGRTWVGRIMSQQYDADGYLRTHLHSEGNKTYCIHKLVAAAFLGPRPPGFVIDHIDGNKGNNRWNNLEWVTPEENRRRSIALGLHAYGERQGGAKLTAERVRIIRVLVRIGAWTQKRAATRYGVSPGLIWLVVNRRVWTHV